MPRVASPSDRPAAAEEAPRVQGCDHPLCTEPGLYRAPRTRRRLDEYYWFCLDHIRDYNRMWNYYEGMGPAEIEAQIREDTVWRRPTWPLGGWRSGRFKASTGGLHDGFGFFADGRDARGRHRERRRKDRAAPRTAEERALAVLDLAPPVTLKEIKTRYKDLVKRLHPDANGGDRSAEERLKAVNQAYSTLKSSTIFKDGACPWTP